MSVLAVGTIALDTIETPFGKEDNVLGGSATYLALAARYLTDSVDVVAVVGGDFPDAYLQLLDDQGVSLAGVQIRESGKTFAWEGRYDYDLNDRETLATHLNVLVDFDPKVPEASRRSKIVCLGNLDPTIQMRALDQMIDPDFVICDTMNYWIENTPESLKEVLARVDCLIINDSESRQIASDPNLVLAAKQILALGPETLVIKKGEHGALLFAGGEVFSAPAFPLEDIHDPTGAGDAFMGGFAGYLARCGAFDVDALRSAVVFGSAMASFTVERFGPRGLLDLHASVVDERLAAFHELGRMPAMQPLGEIA